MNQLEACRYVKTLWDHNQLDKLSLNFEQCSLAHLLTQADRILNNGLSLFKSDVFTVSKGMSWYSGNPVFPIMPLKQMHKQPNHYDLDSHIGQCNYELLIQLIKHYEEQNDE